MAKQVSIVNMRLDEAPLGMYERVFISWQQGTSQGRSGDYAPNMKLVLCNFTFTVRDAPVTITVNAIVRNTFSTRSHRVTIDLHSCPDRARISDLNLELFLRVENAVTSPKMVRGPGVMRPKVIRPVVSQGSVTNVTGREMATPGEVMLRHPLQLELSALLAHAGHWEEIRTLEVSDAIGHEASVDVGSMRVMDGQSDEAEACGELGFAPMPGKVDAAAGGAKVAEDQERSAA
jgi:hypothetical protein